eukprot:1146856-Pelagomonas_calceolata.AAC.16
MCLGCKDNARCRNSHSAPHRPQPRSEAWAHPTQHICKRSRMTRGGERSQQRIAFLHAEQKVHQTNILSMSARADIACFDHAGVCTKEIKDCLVGCSVEDRDPFAKFDARGACPE